MVVYNGCYSVFVGSSENKLEKKINMLLEQNKKLQKEILLIKDKDVINDEEIIDLDYDIITGSDYLE